MTLREQLFAMAEEEYRQFQAKLIPTVDPALILGIRMPKLRALAKEICGTSEAETFLRVLPHTYFEENQLHAALIERISDYPYCLAATELFLPYVDNWATCDSLSPKTFGKNRTIFLDEIRRWITSEKTYTVRFAVKQLMTWYLDESFFPECLAWVAAVDSEDYYVKMMVAWFFATALAKQYEAALPYLEQKHLSVWIHNKTIQKAVESYRITPKQKIYLRSLRKK